MDHRPAASGRIRANSALRGTAVSRHRDVLDTQPGSLPEIKEHVDGLTFVMRPRGVPKTERLVIRSDDAGDLWVSIASDRSRNEQ